MKLLVLFLAVYFASIPLSLGQQTEISVSQKENLLEKSRKQKKTGFILLGAGGAGLVLGGVLAMSGTEEVVNCIGSLNCTNNDGDEWVAGSVMALAGGLAMIGSVPFFISAGNNRQKAAQLSFNSEPIYLQRNTQNGPRSYPALQLTIPLN